MQLSLDQMSPTKPAFPYANSHTEDKKSTKARLTQTKSKTRVSPYPQVMNRILCWAKSVKPNTTLTVKTLVVLFLSSSSLRSTPSLTRTASGGAAPWQTRLLLSWWILPKPRRHPVPTDCIQTQALSATTLVCPTRTWPTPRHTPTPPPATASDARVAAISSEPLSLDERCGGTPRAPSSPCPNRHRTTARATNSHPTTQPFTVRCWGWNHNHLSLKAASPGSCISNVIMGHTKLFTASLARVPIATICSKIACNWKPSYFTFHILKKGEPTPTLPPPPPQYSV